jgi:hypothetical protein
MDTYITVNEIKLAIRDAQNAVSHLHGMLKSINPNAIVVSESTPQKNADNKACDLLPERDPNPIHPDGSACWLHFPLTIDDVAGPVESVSDLFGIMLDVFDAANPITQLPRRM